MYRQWLSHIQHRFTETALGSLGANAAVYLAGGFGMEGSAESMKTALSGFVGDYLKTF